MLVESWIDYLGIVGRAIFSLNYVMAAKMAALQFIFRNSVPAPSRDRKDD